MTEPKPIEQYNVGEEVERFIIPPPSVVDARQDYWLERKRDWVALGMQKTIGRDLTLELRIALLEEAAINLLKRIAELEAKQK